MSENSSNQFTDAQQQALKDMLSSPESASNFARAAYKINKELGGAISAMTMAHLSIGDQVCFEDKQGAYTGIIEKLGRTKVLVKVSIGPKGSVGLSYRVPAQMLLKV